VKELSLDTIRAGDVLRSDILAPLKAGGAVAIFADADVILNGLPQERLRLPDEEEARIARYRQAQDRKTRTAAHGLVRHCLGLLLDSVPQNLHFIRDEKGRPFLAPQAQIDFNLSHSGDFIGVGFSAVGRIGVDVQEMSHSFEWRSIGDAFLNPAEVALIENLPHRLQNRVALEYWSLKEAFLKASGEGIVLAPHHLAPEKRDGLWGLNREGQIFRAAAFGLRDDMIAAWASSGAEPETFLVKA